MVSGAETSVQATEVLALLVISLAYVPIVLNFREDHSRWVFTAYSALLVGFLATTLEALFLPAFFNTLEHAVGILGAGILSLACAHKSSKLFHSGGS